jgi:hypothetical protein
MQRLAKNKKTKRRLYKNERREKGLPFSRKSGHVQLLHNDRVTVCSSQHFGVDVLHDNDINAMILNTKRVVKC